mmetsp:Transcript_11024/g.21276  ORF Transcript_11024/g.21276 Transcript_11024/m.21276 type:complete len:217 (+) Transcript_11024:63-713(+)
MPSTSRGTAPHVRSLLTLHLTAIECTCMLKLLIFLLFSIHSLSRRTSLYRRCLCFCGEKANKPDWKYSNMHVKTHLRTSHILSSSSPWICSSVRSTASGVGFRSIRVLSIVPAVDTESLRACVQVLAVRETEFLTLSSSFTVQPFWSRAPLDGSVVSEIGTDGEVLFFLDSHGCFSLRSEGDLLLGFIHFLDRIDNLDLMDDLRALLDEMSALLKF